jgi:branched-chain amino acid transport system ATP-binding protein
MAVPILEAKGLTKKFGAVTAAANICVSIQPDTVVGLIGGNGAGKTTFINMVTGYLKPTEGQILYHGKDITPLAPRAITQMGICRSFQIPQVFGSLTAYENLLVGMGIVTRASKNWGNNALQGGTAEEAADAMLDRFHLTKYRHSVAQVLPEGVRKLLDIAMAMVVKPKILLLDEPTSGVSADEKFALMDLVLDAIRADKVTVLFVEHDMEIVRRYTHRLLAFYEGKIIADGDTEKVLNEDEVVEKIVGRDPVAKA